MCIRDSGGGVRGGKGVVMAPATPAKLKKGVKRKAESLAPSPVAPAVTYDPIYSPADAKAAKVGTRRESGRQIKKVSDIFII